MTSEEKWTPKDAEDFRQLNRKRMKLLRDKNRKNK